MKAKKKRRSNRVASDDGLCVCPKCGVPLHNQFPEQAARDLLIGINNGLTGKELLAFSRHSFAHND